MRSLSNSRLAFPLYAHELIVLFCLLGHIRLSYESCILVFSVESSGNEAMTIRSHDEPSTLILAIGSSLKVMGNYLHFWPFHSGVPTSKKGKPPTKRPRMDPDLEKEGENESYTCDYAVINFQKTPIDKYAVFVCHLNCDDILKATLDRLGISTLSYDENTDPLRDLAVPLLKEESVTKNRQSIFDH